MRRLFATAGASGATAARVNGAAQVCDTGLAAGLILAANLSTTVLMPRRAAPIAWCGSVPSTTRVVASSPKTVRRSMRRILELDLGT